MELVIKLKRIKKKIFKEWISKKYKQQKINKTTSSKILKNDKEFSYQAVS